MNLTINNASRNALEAIGQASMAAATSKVEKKDLVDVNLQISSVSGDAEVEIPDEVLRRDDALGKLFDQAFSLPAPAMPNFQE